MMFRYASSVFLPIRHHGICQSLKRSAPFGLKHFSTVPTQPTKEQQEEHNNVPQEKPASLIKYGLAGVISYGTTYLSFLAGIYMALETNVITPEYFGLDVPGAIDNFYTYAQKMSPEVTKEAIKESPQLTNYAVALYANRIIKTGRVLISSGLVFGVAKLFRINTKIDSTGDYKLLLLIFALSMFEQDIEIYRD